MTKSTNHATYNLDVLVEQIGRREQSRFAQHTRIEVDPHRDPGADPADEWDRPAPNDPVDHPAHYTSHLARCDCGRGIECIQIAEHMGFCRGNAIKYLWRAGSKGNELEDLRKARWYLDREIARLTGTLASDQTIG